MHSEVNWSWNTLYIIRGKFTTYWKIWTACYLPKSFKISVIRHSVIEFYLVKLMKPLETVVALTTIVGNMWLMILFNNNRVEEFLGAIDAISCPVMFRIIGPLVLLKFCISTIIFFIDIHLLLSFVVETFLMHMCYNFLLFFCSSETFESFLKWCMRWASNYRPEDNLLFHQLKGVQINVII